MASVSFSSIKKSFGSTKVLHGISLDIADGEFMVLVGPSGCGKSTLLRMLAGLEDITGGEIAIDGRVVNDLDSKDRDIAMVFQSYALYPHMSVAENLAFGLKLRGVAGDEIKRRVAEAAQMLGLVDMLERQPRVLSGGQRQRVALGRALVRQPKVFLLDEPLSNLDAKLRLSMRVEIARLHRRLGTTMIYVTHDQIEAMTLGQRIVVFNRGEIQQIDTPMNLYTKPANLFVAGFLGSPAMNFFRGILRANGHLYLDCGATILSLGEDAGVTARLQNSLNKEIIAGIRPEDLRPVAATASVGPSLSAQLDVVEPVGNEVFLNLSCGGAEIVARTPPGNLPEPGSQLSLAYAPMALHFFDAKTEQRIEGRGEKGDGRG